MAIVRELITLLGTEFGDKGLKQYETGIARIKELALATAKMIGIAFSAEKIYEFVDGLIDSGKEINKIRTQLTNIARPMDDVNEAMQRTFEIAQMTGKSYEQVADTFRDFLQSSADSVVSQEALLKVTENIFKASKVDRLSAEQEQTLFRIIQRVDVIGKASPRMIGMLQNTSISALNILKQYFKTDEDGLRELAKQGKITFEEFTKALGSTSVDLEDKFGRVPHTIGFGLTYARNELVKVTADLLKLQRVSIWFGNTIIWLTDKTVYYTKTFFNAIGGLKNAIEVLGIAMALVLGPRMIGYLIELVSWTVKFTIASWRAIIPWLAIPAAILGIAIAIQDLSRWIQGRPSLIATWAGSFADIKDNFKNMDAFAGFRVFDDLISGKWTQAWKDMKLAITDVNAIVLELTASIFGLSVLFLGWKLFKFPVAAIRNAFKVAPEAAAGAADAAAVGGKAAPKVAPVAGQGSLPLVGGGVREAFSFGGLSTGIGIMVAYDYAQKYMDKLAPNQDKKLQEIGDRVDQWLLDKFSFMKPGMGKLGEWIWGKDKPAYGGASIDSKTGNFGTPGAGGLGLTPPPGAMGPPVAPAAINNDNKQITVTQTNNVTVSPQETAIGDIVARQIGTWTKDLVSGLARDLGRSSPRTEAATQ